MAVATLLLGHLLKTLVLGAQDRPTRRTSSSRSHLYSRVYYRNAHYQHTPRPFGYNFHSRHISCQAGSVSKSATLKGTGYFVWLSGGAQPQATRLASSLRLTHLSFAPVDIYGHGDIINQGPIPRFENVMIIAMNIIDIVGGYSDRLSHHACPIREVF